MSVALEDRPCPTCGSQAETSPCAVKSLPPGESFSFNDLKPYWNKTLKDRIFLSYHRCNRCGLLYCPRYFSQAQLNELYAGMLDNTAGVSLDILRQTQKGYFDVLKKFSPLHGDYLEVGPDIGLFVQYCVNEGSFEKFWLFEPNTSVQDALSNAARGKDFHIVPSMLNTDLVPDQRVSVVVMVHVLDHLLDPVGTLRALLKKLPPSAVLLFVTHDESSLLARVTGRRWGAYSLEHPQLLNSKSVTHLMHAAGYKVLTVQKTHNYFPLSFLFNYLMHMLGLHSTRYPFTRDHTLRLKLGNIVTIASPR